MQGLIYNIRMHKNSIEESVFLINKFDGKYEPFYTDRLIESCIRSLVKLRRLKSREDYVEMLRYLISKCKYWRKIFKFERETKP